MDTKRISRRSLIRNTSIAGTALLAGSALNSLFPLNALANLKELPKGSLNREKIQETKLLMGTFVTITAHHASRTKLDEAIGKSFLEVERLVAIFDRYDSKSALSVLNDQSKLLGAPTELGYVLGQAKELSIHTKDLFNPAIAPLIDLYAKNNGSLTRQELIETLELTKPDKFKITKDKIQYDRKGTQFTLDGIAKGYIADLASKILRKEGVGDHIINAGGDIKISGLAPNSNPWQIGIENPFGSGRSLSAKISLKNSGAVATSGNYERFYGSKKHHHIMNHITGQSPALASLTVIAPTALEADALSTALALLPPADAIKYVNFNTQGAECLIIGNQGQKYQSKNWPSA